MAPPDGPPPPPLTTPAPATSPGDTTATPAPPSAVAPPAGALESNTTGQTIIQIQISACIAYCHGVDLLQQAVQSNATVQAVGTAAELATALEAPPESGPAAHGSRTITQIQFGCVSSCFGATTTHPATGALTQLVLSDLSSLLPPSASARLPPVSAAQQSVTQQVACQVQDGDPEAAQVQSASQTSATVQIIEVASSLPTGLATAPLAPQPAAEQPVDRTEQQTWQLQIGCLFYCVDSKQVQQAQQQITTIQIVAGTPGSPATAAVAVEQQTIWQLQIGCLAWCWDSTQVQVASNQSTIVVLTPPEDGPAPGRGPAPGPGPARGPGPAPGPGPSPGPGVGAGPAPGSEVAPGPAPGRGSTAATTAPPEPAAMAPTPAPPGPPPPATPGGRAVIVRALGSPRRTGVAILASQSLTTTVVPGRPVAAASASTGETAAAAPVLRPVAPRHAMHSHQAVDIPPIPRPQPSRISRAPAITAGSDSDQPIGAWLLALTGAGCLAAIFMLGSYRRAER